MIKKIITSLIKEHVSNIRRISGEHTVQCALSLSRTRQTHPERLNSASYNQVIARLLTHPSKSKGVYIFGVPCIGT